MPIAITTGAAGAAYLAFKNDNKVLSTRRTGVIANAGPAAPGAAPGPFGNPAHGWDYYGKCMIGGILSCGLTHLAVTPLDVVKCRMQVRFSVVDLKI